MGNEGHSPLRDRKAGPAQLFEISSLSNLKIDSPPTFLSSFGDFSLPGYNKESTDDGDGGAKPDLFDVSGEADSNFLKGKFVCIESKLHNKDTQAPFTVFPPAPCEWCLYPLTHCLFHPVAHYQDRPLVGNRRLWPSQHFDPFETSPSGMEADSPSSFKKTVDEDEVIKSCTCQGSGEASIYLFRCRESV